MGKQELRQRETNVSTKEGVGKQLEQTFTVDDSALPSPHELEAYQRIDPRTGEYGDRAAGGYSGCHRVRRI